MPKHKPSDLTSLQEMAEDYLSSCSFRRQHDSDKLIRDKTSSYFDDIVKRNGGLMEPYPKDCHGDQRCPLNKERTGLFFSALMPGVNSEMSIFGKQRFQVNASALFGEGTNIYFADFYCVPGKGEDRPHYVTLAVTQADSYDDKFCKVRLIPLNRADNPFFMVSVNGSSVKLKTTTAKRFHVELFYTETVNISKLIKAGQASLSTVTLAEYGSEVRRQRDKTSNCELCNLRLKK